MKQLISPLYFIPLLIISTHSAHAFEVTCINQSNPACTQYTPNQNTAISQTANIIIVPASSPRHTDTSKDNDNYADLQEHFEYTNDAWQIAPPPELSYNPEEPSTSSIGPAGRRSSISHLEVCHPEARALGIYHFRYNEAPAADLVWSGYGNKGDAKYKIHKSAKVPLTQLINAAKKDGVILKPNSIFRSIARQRQIIADKRRSQNIKQIYAVSAPAGYSEHHTGLAVDFNSIGGGFDNSKAYRWLTNNAHNYGWEQTFTEDYANWSGVTMESWHWRYVGKNNEFAHLFSASKNHNCG